MTSRYFLLNLVTASTTPSSAKIKLVLLSHFSSLDLLKYNGWKEMNSAQQNIRTPKNLWTDSAKGIQSSHLGNLINQKSFDYEYAIPWISGYFGSILISQPRHLFVASMNWLQKIEVQTRDPGIRRTLMKEIMKTDISFYFKLQWMMVRMRLRLRGHK